MYPWVPFTFQGTEQLHSITSQSKVNKSLPKNRLNWKACKDMSCSKQYLAEAEEKANTKEQINGVLKGISHLCEEQMLSGCSCSDLILSCCIPGFGYCCCWRTVPSKSWLIASFTWAAKQQIITIFALAVKKQVYPGFFCAEIWAGGAAADREWWTTSGPVFIIFHFDFNKWMAFPMAAGWGAGSQGLKSGKPDLNIENIFSSCWVYLVFSSCSALAGFGRWQQ